MTSLKNINTGYLKGDNGNLMNASLPIQPLVVFSNPSLQTHLYEPSVLTQSAVAVSQGMSVSLHSLMSLLHNVPVQPDLQTHPCL